MVELYTASRDAPTGRDAIVFEGWLKKMSGSRFRGLQRRYFRLANTWLSYSDSDAPDARERGRIWLGEVLDVSRSGVGETGAIFITTVRKRYELRADSRFSANTWYDALKAAWGSALELSNVRESTAAGAGAPIEATPRLSEQDPDTATGLTAGPGYGERHKHVHSSDDGVRSGETGKRRQALRMAAFSRLREYLAGNGIRWDSTSGRPVPVSGDDHVENYVAYRADDGAYGGSVAIGDSVSAIIGAALTLLQNARAASLEDLAVVILSLSSVIAVGIGLDGMDDAHVSSFSQALSILAGDEHCRQVWTESEFLRESFFSCVQHIKQFSLLRVGRHVSECYFSLAEFVEGSIGNVRKDDLLSISPTAGANSSTDSTASASTVDDAEEVDEAVVTATRRRLSSVHAQTGWHTTFPDATPVAVERVASPGVFAVAVQLLGSVDAGEVLLSVLDSVGRMSAVPSGLLQLLRVSVPSCLSRLIDNLLSASIGAGSTLSRSDVNVLRSINVRCALQAAGCLAEISRHVKRLSDSGELPSVLSSAREIGGLLLPGTAACLLRLWRRFVAVLDPPHAITIGESVLCLLALRLALDGPIIDASGHDDMEAVQTHRDFQLILSQLSTSASSTSTMARAASDRTRSQLVQGIPVAVREWSCAAIPRAESLFVRSFPNEASELPDGLGSAHRDVEEELASTQQQLHAATQALRAARLEASRLRDRLLVVEARHPTAGHEASDDRADHGRRASRIGRSIRASGPQGVAAIDGADEESVARTSVGDSETVSVSTGIRDSGLSLGAAQLSFLKSLPLFHSFSEAQFSRMVMSLGVEDFAVGEMIVKEGDIGRTFYVIAAGKVAVYKRSHESGAAAESADSDDSSIIDEDVRARGSLDDDEAGVAADRRVVNSDASSDYGSQREDESLGDLVAELSKGFFFGEQSLLRDERRSATCMAITNVTCFTLDRRVFLELVSSVGSILGDHGKMYAVTLSKEGLSLARHVNSFASLLEDAESIGDAHFQQCARGHMSRERAMVDVMSSIVGERTLRDLTDSVIARLCDYCSAESAIVVIPDPKQHRYTFLGGPAHGRHVSSSEAGVLHQVARSGVVVRADDVVAHPDFALGGTIGSESPDSLGSSGSRAVEKRALWPYTLSMPQPAPDLAVWSFLGGIVVGNDEDGDAFLDERPPTRVNEGRATGRMVARWAYTRTWTAFFQWCRVIRDCQTLPDTRVWVALGGRFDRTWSVLQTTTGRAVACRLIRRLTCRYLTRALARWRERVDSLCTCVNLQHRRPKASGCGSLQWGRALRRIDHLLDRPPTESLICAPIRDSAGNVSGVLLMSNKRGSADSHVAGSRGADSRSSSDEDVSTDAAPLLSDRGLRVLQVRRRSLEFLPAHIAEQSSVSKDTATAGAHPTERRQVEREPCGFSDREELICSGIAVQLGAALEDRCEQLPGSSVSHLHVTSIRQKFRVRVSRVSRVTVPSDVETYSPEGPDGSPEVTVSLCLFHGIDRLAADQCSSAARRHETRQTRTGKRHHCFWWDEWLITPLSYYNLPTAIRLFFSVSLKNGTPIGWAGCALFNHTQVMRTGPVKLRLVEGAFDESRAVTSLTLERDPEMSRGPVLEVELMGFDSPVLSHNDTRALQAVGATGGAGGMRRHRLSFTDAALGPDVVAAMLTASRDDERHALASSMMNSGGGGSGGSVSSHLRDLGDRLHRVLQADPLTALSPEDRALVWGAREGLCRLSSALPRFLESVRWGKAGAVAEARQLMYRWSEPRLLEVLQLLDRRFADPLVRAFAVKHLDDIDDDTLLHHLLQLVQVLKFEPNLDSALARFLLRRALRAPRTVGHVLFWLLKSEMHVQGAQRRFSVILEQYLRNSGEHRTELGHQMFIMSRLEQCARKVKAQSTPAARIAVLREVLPQIVFPSETQLPLSPHLVARRLIVERCRVMDSKKLPLWLVFESPDPSEPPFEVLLKVGDDLRQDQLTLQVLSTMDRLWRIAGLDLRSCLYRCVSTGNEVGMLEAVPQAYTLAGIIGKSIAGGSKRPRGRLSRRLRAALSVFTQENVLVHWLAEQGYDEEVWHENFIRSCAGCCVATYVLGIGDRHNDNIMLTRDGRLFHIDFGHFLGNFKKKYGYKREKAPFVFTPAFAAVIGKVSSAAFRRFEDLCCRAYNVLRRNSQLLITQFYLMTSCGIPELEKQEDIHWIRDKLALGLTDDAAAARFRELIHVSLHTKTTLLNDASHLLKRG